MMNEHPYFEMSAPSSEEEYFDTPPFYNKDSLLPKLQAAHLMNLHSQPPAGLVAKGTKIQHAAQEEEEFVQEARAFLQHQGKLCRSTNVNSFAFNRARICHMRHHTRCSNVKREDAALSC